MIVVLAVRRNIQPVSFEFRNHIPVKQSIELKNPVELIEWIIKTYTNPGEIVLDSCAGSGTTAIAAMNTGRNWICFENDKDIYEAAEDRIKEYQW
nr:DNA methyltransferase [Clostridium sp. AM45-5]